MTSFCGEEKGNKKSGTDASVPDFLFCSEVDFLTALDAVSVFCGCAENHVARGVDRGFQGILHDADDKADADHLHCNVGTDTEERACHRDEEEGAARNARRTARTEGRNKAKKECQQNIDADPLRECRREGEHRDGDCRAVHVDGCTERDCNGVVFLVKTELLAKGHIDGDVCRRASCKECGNARLAEATEDQRVGIAAECDRHDQRINDQCDTEHTTDEHQKELSVIHEDVHSVLADRGEDQTHDTEGGNLNDPTDHAGNRVGNIGEDLFCAVARQLTQGKTENHRPCKDADVVAVHNCGNGVLHHVAKQGTEDLAKSRGGGVVGTRALQGNGHTEDEGDYHGNGGGKEGAQQIKEDYGAEALADARARLRKRRDDEYEDENGSDRLQRAYEHLTEDGDEGCLGQKETQANTDHKTDGDAKDEGGFCVKREYLFHVISNSFPSLFSGSVDQGDQLVPVVFLAEIEHGRRLQAILPVVVRVVDPDGKEACIFCRFKGDVGVLKHAKLRRGELQPLGGKQVDVGLVLVLSDVRAGEHGIKVPIQPVM